jgi:two-component system, NarL family, response regulator YdfI
MESRSVVRVQIAAGSAVVRAGLEAVVHSSSSLEFVRAVPLDALTNELSETLADVILVDLPQLDDEWVSALAEIHIPLVLLTDASLPALLAACFRAGVRAVLSPDSASAEIAAAICAAAVGLVTMQPSTLDILSAEPQPVREQLAEPLSPREREVLSMVSEGLSNKLIAFRLGISEHTVKFHVMSIMGKLNAGSRTDAVMQAVRRGLIVL